MKKPEIISVTQVQLDTMLVLAKPTFAPDQYELLKGVFETYSYVMRALQNAKTSLKRFRQMLFGSSTESKDKVLAGSVTGGEAVQESGVTAPIDTPADTPATPERKARKGHGRNAASAYCDSQVIEIEVPDLESGDLCPECLTGKVYESPPKLIVKVIGQPPLGAKLFKLLRVRCRICDAVFTAPMPDGQSAAPKYRAPN